MLAKRWIGSIALVLGAVYAHAADLYYLQAGLLYQYNTATNTVGPGFGAGYALDQYVGYPQTGLEVGSDGTVYAEAMVGGMFGTAVFQKFDGTTGANIGSIPDDTLGNESPIMGPDGRLYMSSAQYVQNVGEELNGLMSVNPVTGASYGNLIAPGNPYIYLLPAPLWLPNGQMLMTDGDNKTIQEFNPKTGAYEGIFASQGGYQLGDMAYANGTIYVGDYGDQQVLKFSATTGSFLGELLTGPLNGYMGRIEIADGQLFAQQVDPNTYGDYIYEYSLATGALEMQLNTNGPVDNFAFPREYQAVPEPMPLLGLGVGLAALIRRRRSR